MIFALSIIFSIGAISASDVNMTDSIAESEIQAGELESVNSNNLSTGIESTSLNENSKNQTELTSPTDDIYYKGSYEVVLKDSNTNNTIANRDVNFVINNVNYTATTDSNGVASVNLTLNPGKYSLIAYFAGDGTYANSNNITSTLEVLSTIKANDITKYYLGSTQYSATFFDSNGNVLANRDVTITVNGKSYTKKTNSKGVASLAINLKLGTYKVVATDPITGYKLTTTFKILSTISAANVKKVIVDNKKFTAKFLKNNG